MHCSKQELMSAVKQHPCNWCTLFDSMHGSPIKSPYTASAIIYTYYIGMAD